ncbi:hypothetical protein BH11PSE8_BH11PSE8_10810 [soil metagenome]
MSIRPFVPAVLRTLLATAALWSAASSAQAACPLTDEPCTLDLGNATVTFGHGWSSVSADYQISGQDGYGWADAQFGSLQATQNGNLLGFSLSPYVTSNVGNGGYNGVHEVSAWIDLNDVSFAAKPGYQLDSLVFVVAGSFSQSGSGNVTFDMPGSLAIFPSTGAYVSTAVVSPFDTSFHAGFTTTASYFANDDGTASVTGQAEASITALRLTAHVSAVPEPQTLALFGFGLLAVTARTARRRSS